MKGNLAGLLIMAFLAALAVSLALFSPMLWQEKTSNAANEPVVVEPVLIAAKGVVESEEEIEVSNLVMGTILEVRANEGDRVEKGQILAVIDKQKIMTKARLPQARLREAKAHLKELEAGSRQEDIEMAKSRSEQAKITRKQAKREYNRQKRLYRTRATTLVEYEMAEERMRLTAEEVREAEAHLAKLIKGARPEEIEQARAAVEKADSELSYYQVLLKDYTISSPIDGLVAERYKDAGETVNPGTPLMKIINPDRLRIRAELEETDVGRVSEGQPVEVTVEAYQNRVYQGEVYKVFPVLKRFTLRAFDPSAVYDIYAQDIYARLRDFSGLKNGMQVTVKFLE